MSADNRHASSRRENEEERGWRGTASTHHHKWLTPRLSRDLQHTYPLHKYNRTQKQNLTNTTPNNCISIVKTATYSQIKMTHWWIEREREVRCEARSRPEGREREGGGELLPAGTHSFMKRRTRYFILTLSTVHYAFHLPFFSFPHPPTWSTSTATALQYWISDTGTEGQRAGPGLV